MNIQDAMQASWHAAIGATSTVLEFLQNPYNNDSIWQSLVAKGERVEKELENYLRDFLPPPQSKQAYYIERGGEQSFIQPSLLQEMRVWGFFVPASLKHLQDTCDRYLNQRGKTLCHPASDFVLVTCQQISARRSLLLPDSNKGFFRQEGVSIWIPTIVTQNPHIAWFAPYSFVDTSLAMATGREVYGLDEQIGFIDILNKDIVPESLTVEAVAIEHFSPQARGTRQQILEIKRVAGDPTGLPDRHWESEEVAIDELIRLLHETEAVNLSDIVRQAIAAPATIIALKQFRDVKNGSIALTLITLAPVTLKSKSANAVLTPDSRSLE